MMDRGERSTNLSIGVCPFCWKLGKITDCMVPTALGMWGSVVWGPLSPKSALKSEGPHFTTTPAITSHPRNKL